MQANGLMTIWDGGTDHGRKRIALRCLPCHEVIDLPYWPLYAGTNLTPALITPGKKCGQPPLWATVLRHSVTYAVISDKALQYK